MSLAEIKQIVEADEAREQLNREYRAAGDSKTRLEMLRQSEQLTASQIEILDRKMSQMLEMKVELRARLAHCRSQIAELSESEAVERQP